MAAVDWADGYNASYRLMEVDPATWADRTEIGYVTSFSVSRGSDGDLLESGRAEIGWSPQDVFAERWCRMEVLAEQGGAVERAAVATMLLAPTSGTRGAGYESLSLEGRSVLSPASDERLPAGTYVPAGADGAAYAANLLRSCIPAPVVVVGSFRLAEPMVFSQGTTKLGAVWMLLDAAGWTMRISGDGTVTISAPRTEPSLVLDRASASFITGDVHDDADRWAVPNRYVATMDGETAVAVNEDPTDAFSHARRGRWVDVEDDSPTLLAGESLREYAERRLRAASTPARTCEWERSWHPDVTVGDVIRCDVAGLGLSDDLRVVSQSVRLGAMVAVTERAEVLR